MRTFALRDRPAYIKKRYVVSAGSWIVVVAPMNANYVGLRNVGPADNNPDHAGAVRTRTDPSDASTEDAIASGTQEGITAPFVPIRDAPCRFLKKHILLGLSSANEYDQVVVATWVQ